VAVGKLRIYRCPDGRQPSMQPVEALVPSDRIRALGETKVFQSDGPEGQIRLRELFFIGQFSGEKG
jgi:hypothetical protein